MDVILTTDVPKVGARGERVRVAAGYARNFLLPRQLAVLATDGNLRAMKEEEKLAGVRGKKLRHEAEKVADFLSKNEILTTLKIGREGKAFGAVTAMEIAVLLRKTGLEVDRRRIQLERPIKRLGVFDIALSMHQEVATTVRLFVDREGGSKEGAIREQEKYDTEIRLAEETAKAESEARAARAKEAEEAVRIAVEKAAARKAREEAEAAARAEKIAQKHAEEAESPEE
jgi:large subunit ribosomal protein L9